jgi:DNA-binding PadR family transcriptional regulator
VDTDNVWDQMLEQASYRQLKSLLKAQTNIRRSAERMARDAREAMEALAVSFAPDEVNKYSLANPAGLDMLDIQELAEMTREVLRKHVGELEEQTRYAERRVAELEEENEQLRSEMEWVKKHWPGQKKKPVPEEKEETDGVWHTPPKPKPKPRRPAWAPAPKATARSRRSGQGADSDPVTDRQELPPWRMLRARPAPPKPAADVGIWPGWALTWRKESKNLNRDRDVVLIVGTGLALQRDVDEQLAQWWNIKPGSGSIRRAFGRVEAAGLIEIIKPRKETQGWRPRYLIRLTERGKDIYKLFRGEPPGPSHATALLKRHKSKEHAALNLEAAELLWRAGYEVKLFPDNVSLESGGTYHPDLLIIDQDGCEMLYVECERMASTDIANRSRKWELYYEASEGHFCVITPSEETREIARKGLLEWAGDRALTLWMGDMERSRAENVWLVKHPS